MNKFVKIAVILLAVAIILGGCVYMKLFYLGSYNIDDVNINKVTVGANSIVIDGVLTSSGDAYKEYDYQLVGTELYVKIKTVMVSKKYDSGSFNINIPVDGSSVKNIYISDNKRTKAIYGEQS